MMRLNLSIGAANNPHVWTGGALQEGSVRLESSGVAPMYPAFGWSRVAPGHHGCKRAFDLISRQASSGAIGVTSSRSRREDRCSIASFLSRRPWRGMGFQPWMITPLHQSISLVRPRRRLSPAPTSGAEARGCQGRSASGPPEGLGLESIEHDGTLAQLGSLRGLGR
jgi:hypothetical protein